MENIRTIIVGIVGLAIAALMIVVMATVGLAVIGFTVVAGITGLLIAKFGNRRKMHKPQGPRVWNDGHGKIIDM
jgi:hypothetical protein